MDNITRVSVREIIQKRKSVRSYNPQALENRDREKVHMILNKIQAETSPFGGKVRFELIDAFQDTPAQRIRLGTYGFIHGAQHYILAIVDTSAYALEATGYLFEKIIIELTKMDLGTCWIGGSLSKRQFSSQINLEENEFIVAVTPVGYKAEKKTIRDRVIKKVARSHRRKDWHQLFFKNDLDMLDKGSLGKIGEALEMVRLAPSARNRQPWRIIMDGTVFHFYLDTGGKQPHSKSLLLIDIGIAVAHFDLMIAEKRVGGKWEIVDNKPHIDNWLYKVSWIRE